MLEIGFRARTHPEVLPGRGRSDSITALRGIIAVLVLVHHGLPLLNLFNNGPPSPAILTIFGFPDGRIEFFFVVSGYFIARRHVDDIGQPGAIRDFLRRRFHSIYPGYWLILGGLLLLGLSPIGYTHVSYPAARTIVSSVFLVGIDDRDVVLPPSWTLFHEVLFYGVFAAALASRAVAMGLALGWAILILADQAGMTLRGIPHYVIDPVNLLFGMGAGAALWARRRPRVPGRALLAVSIVTAAMLLHQDGPIGEAPGHLLWGLVWMAAITGFVGIEAERRLPVPASLLTLGRASYMIYLMHLPLQSQSFQVVMRLHLDRFLNSTDWLLLSTAIIVGLAIAANILVERPLQSWLRQRRDRKAGLAVPY